MVLTRTARGRTDHRYMEQMLECQPGFSRTGMAIRRYGRNLVTAGWLVWTRAKGRVRAKNRCQRTPSQTMDARSPGRGNGLVLSEARQQKEITKSLLRQLLIQKRL
jgi:hypothetical protein